MINCLHLAILSTIISYIFYTYGLSNDQIPKNWNIAMSILRNHSLHLSGDFKINYTHINFTAKSTKELHGDNNTQALDQNSAESIRFPTYQDLDLNFFENGNVNSSPDKGSGKIVFEVVTVPTITHGSEEALLNRSSVLFVAVSFILLMVISLAWLVFYYIQRFRYLHSKERVSRRLAELAKKAVARIPVKTLHPGDRELRSDSEQCAICIEAFRPLDSIRTLPCRHYFHKVCIDPWLLEQRSCPMCKLDILQAYGLRSELFYSYGHMDPNSSRFTSSPLSVGSISVTYSMDLVSLMGGCGAGQPSNANLAVSPLAVVSTSASHNDQPAQGSSQSMLTLTCCVPSLTYVVLTGSTCPPSFLDSSQSITFKAQSLFIQPSKSCLNMTSTSLKDLDTNPHQSCTNINDYTAASDNDNRPVLAAMSIPILSLPNNPLWNPNVVLIADSAVSSTATVHGVECCLSIQTVTSSFPTTTSPLIKDFGSATNTTQSFNGPVCSIKTPELDILSTTSSPVNLDTSHMRLMNIPVIDCSTALHDIDRIGSSNQLLANPNMVYSSLPIDPKPSYFCPPMSSANSNFRSQRLHRLRKPWSPQTNEANNGLLLVHSHSHKHVPDSNVPFNKFIRKWFALPSRSSRSFKAHRTRNFDSTDSQRHTPQSLSLQCHQPFLSLGVHPTTALSVPSTTLFLSKSVSRNDLVLTNSTASSRMNQNRSMHSDVGHQSECIVTAMVEDFPSEHGTSSTPSLDSVYHLFCPNEHNCSVTHGLDEIVIPPTTYVGHDPVLSMSEPGLGTSTETVSMNS